MNSSVTNKKKKFFFLLFSMNVGGVEKSLLGFLSTFDRTKIDIHIGLLKKQGAFLKALPEDVIIHQCFKGLWDVINLPPLTTIKSLLKKGKIIEAIVHLYCYSIFKLTGSRLSFYKYILRNESKIDIVFDEAHAFAGPASMLDYYICRKIKAKRRFSWIHFDIKKNGIDKVLTRRLFPEYNNIYIVSKAAKKIFDYEFPQFAKKTEVRYSIVLKENIIKSAITAPTFNDDFKGIRILTVGRLSLEKGQDIAVKALKILVEQGFDIKWYYVGEGNMLNEYKLLTEKYGLSERIVFLGMITNPYGYMRDCDIYVQPSRHEGYCITLAEARCFKVPIVATNFLAAKEQLENYQKCIITGFTPQDLANGIKVLL